MAEIIIRTLIDAPMEVCFDVARDVAAHLESAAFSGERLVAPGKWHGLLELGDLVCFEARHLGVRQKFCARITLLDRPDRFVDEMTEGAFSWLRHVHEFFAVEDGTLMIDHLSWKTPCGILGTIVDWVFLKRHMTWFVRTKQEQLKRIAESSCR